MMKVILGRYAAVPGRPLHPKNITVFGSDAFWAPEHGVLGLATSWHHYHLYPISGRDVQVAFDIVRSELGRHDSSEPIGKDFLHGLLHAVHHGFAKIDIRTHIVGLEFESTGLPGLPDPVDDPESAPMVYIALLQFQGRHLSIAGVGNFLVYVVRSAGLELIFGLDWFSGAQAANVDSPFGGPHLAAHLKMPKIYSCDVEIKPDDLILAATPTLAEIIALSKLEQFMSKRGDLESVSAHLMATLKSIVPGSIIDFEEPHKVTKSTIGTWGAAWAVACIEG